MRSPRNDLATRSGGASRRFRVVLVAYIVIASVYVVVDIVTEGLGKSVVGPLLALIVGVILWFREWEGAATRD